MQRAASGIAGNGLRTLLSATALNGTKNCNVIRVDEAAAYGGMNTGNMLKMVCNPDGARHISLQAVKIRMKSVTNIKKITAAMKMVAASKLVSETGSTVPSVFSLRDSILV